jgi:hypothetical protein
MNCWRTMEVAALWVALLSAFGENTKEVEGSPAFRGV